MCYLKIYANLIIRLINYKCMMKCQVASDLFRKILYKCTNGYTILTVKCVGHLMKFYIQYCHGLIRTPANTGNITTYVRKL